ncbi:MAG: diaminopimelate epimerase [Brevinematia bacterium]
MNFTKAEALGNDYILIDFFKNKGYDKFLDKMSEISQVLSDRHFGIGGDGVILIMPNSVSDCEMRIFNSDGSEAEMCGNGIRQVARYYYERIERKNEIQIYTKAGIKRVSVLESNELLFKVDMGEAILESGKIPIDKSMLSKDIVIDEEFDFGFSKYRINLVSMGNPHCVIFTDDLSNLNLSEVGPKIENHPLFPKRTNVEFVKVINNSEIAMRVWERGSGETMACGTGACASVVAAMLNRVTSSKRVKVHLLGGNLEIEIGSDNHVYMIGGANIVFEGKWVKGFWF